MRNKKIITKKIRPTENPSTRGGIDHQPGEGRLGPVELSH